MSFFYDNISGQSGLTQYDRYLENSVYLGKLKFSVNDPVNYQLLEIRRVISENIATSNDNTKALFEANKKQVESLTNTVCGTLERGFNQVTEELEDINWRLNDINEGVADVNKGISKLHSMLDWKTDLLIENQRITNLFMGKIVNLLKIPDSQKQRGYYVEQGMNYLKNAIEEGTKSDFFTDALDELTKAQQIEEKDFFTLHKLGLIYLNSKKHLDIEKADSYFRMSARYSKAAANVAISQKQISYNDEIFSKEILLEETASALNYASRCNYIKTSFRDAIDLAKQANEIQPNNPEYGFQLAKCYSANGQDQQAAEALKKVIEIDKYYSIKALSDMDFVKKQIIRDSIGRVAKDLILKVNNKIDEIEKVIINDSIAKNNFNKIKELFNEPNYLNARTVNLELERVQKWDVVSYIGVPDTFNPKTSFTTTLLYKEVVTKEDLNISMFIQKEYENNKIKKSFDEKQLVNRDIASKNWEKLKKKEQNKKIFLTVGAFVIAVILGFLLHFIISLVIIGWAIWMIWYKPYKENKDLMKRLMNRK